MAFFVEKVAPGLSQLNGKVTTPHKDPVRLGLATKNPTMKALDAMARKTLPDPTGPAITELRNHLQDNGVAADPRQVATALIAIARDKVKKGDPRELLAWIQQLAMDVIP